jgi:aryl-alcohol dehydrogenase-like predicted oxidoreductase
MFSLAMDPPSIGVGTWAWGNQFLWGYGPDQDAQLAAAFQRAVDLGLHFFDTADSYGTGRFSGRSETLLGSWCWLPFHGVLAAMGSTVRLPLPVHG